MEDRVAQRRVGASEPRPKPGSVCETSRLHLTDARDRGSSAHAAVKAVPGRPRTGSCHHRVLEVRDARRLDRPNLLELHLRGPDAVEEASTVAEQYWNHVEFKLVQ